jgi:hypothetical protein
MAEWLPQSYWWQFLWATAVLVLCTLICLAGSGLFARCSNGLLLVLLVATISIPLSAAVKGPFLNPKEDIVFTGLSMDTFRQNLLPNFTRGAKLPRSLWYPVPRHRRHLSWCEHERRFEAPKQSDTQRDVVRHRSDVPSVYPCHFRHGSVYCSGNVLQQHKCHSTDQHIRRCHTRWRDGYIALFSTHGSYWLSQAPSGSVKRPLDSRIVSLRSRHQEIR